jgi:hypothetical protein
LVSMQLAFSSPTLLLILEGEAKHFLSSELCNWL